MRHVTLCTAFVLYLTSFGQTWSFPTSNATWVQYYEVMVTPLPLPQFAWISTANFCMGISDTLIGGVAYSQLHYCGAAYVGGIREEDQAVYFYPADSTQEYLLYDFGAAVGDTLEDIYVNEPLGLNGSSGWLGTGTFDLLVQESAPSADHGGRIRMRVQAIDPNVNMDSEWVEGIGCVHGLFNFNPINISEYWYGLECMSHNGTLLWNGSYAGTDGSCSPIFLGVEEIAPTSLRAYPNPTVDRVRVEGLGRTLVVRDALGRIVAAPVTRVARDIADIDLSALASGPYIVQDERGLSVRAYRE
ncbi:MAG: T9SS type A sorting domain-containing protein [Flavobacteriales bacterium]|jgi:hypothetical protein|nr:T9SS type A sorting domain-containing protein [Flavobacteriales bacterium]